MSMPLQVNESRDLHRLRGSFATESAGRLSSVVKSIEFHASNRCVAQMGIYSAVQAVPLPPLTNFCLRLHLSSCPSSHETDYGEGWLRRVPGSFILIPPGTGSAIRGEPNNHFESLLLEFPEAQLRQIAGELLESEGAHLVRPPGKERIDHYVSFMMKQMWARIRGQSAGEELIFEGMLISLVGHLLTLGEKGHSPFPETERGANAIVKKALRYMRENLSEKISIADIAGAAHVSRPYIAKVFRKATGRSVHDHLMELRIERAKELITYFGKNFTFAEIAKECGFSDGGHLTRSFVHFVGVTPQSYRDSR